MCLIELVFSSVLQIWYVEVQISRSISESPLEFEIMIVDCTIKAIVIILGIGLQLKQQYPYLTTTCISPFTDFAPRKHDIAFGEIIVELLFVKVADFGPEMALE